MLRRGAVFADDDVAYDTGHDARGAGDGARATPPRQTAAIAPLIGFEIDRSAACDAR
jgi:hypothetical protein